MDSYLIEYVAEIRRLSPAFKFAKGGGAVGGVVGWSISPIYYSWYIITPLVLPCCRLQAGFYGDTDRVS